MSKPEEVEADLEDEEYDEEADSDFDAASAGSREPSSSSDEQEDADLEATTRSQKRRKVQKPEAPVTLELDSGDEATIEEHKTTRRKRQKKVEYEGDDSGHESEGWRARTRAMRDRDKDEKKQNKLASIKGSTIDVEKLWKDMNRTDFMLNRPIKQTQAQLATQTNMVQQDTVDRTADDSSNKENDPGLVEMITIRRTYKFAGEIHTEEKIAPKSSAEAQLWLAQQSSKPRATDPEGRVINRPVRKISRFDPNFSNLEFFKAAWTASLEAKQGPTGPKLNVVEKSKMDWAVHVDAEGLKEELDMHAKAKEGYLNRMDFLRDVESRKEGEARAARLQGQ